jgi:sensor domain CHASE-containing protein
MALYVAFVLVLLVGYATGRWRCHAEAAETFARAARVTHALTEALTECPEICEKYAAEEAARDNLEEPPDEAIVKESWVQSIEAACVTLGAQDCAMLVRRHVQDALEKARQS